MPLPFILGAIAAAAAVGGVGSGIHGAVQMKDANDTMKAAEYRHNRNMEKFEDTSKETNQVMDDLGKLELNILHSFDAFSDTIEKIQNRPQFKEYNNNGVKLPQYNKEELKSVSVGAGVLLGGIGGAAVGTAGGFAAAGVTTSAVMALGTASTGAAISSLSGAAATNATLAALGGGAIQAGGGGMLLGSTILGATTLGVGLLVGGVIFNVVGGNLSDKADEAWSQMKKAEETINRTCEYLNDLKEVASKYTCSIRTVNDIYINIFATVSHAVNESNKTNWYEFSETERKATENAVLLVGLLYKMCQVNLVNKSNDDKEINTVNHQAVDKSMRDAEDVIKNLK